MDRRSQLFKAAMVVVAGALFFSVFRIQNSLNRDRDAFGLTTVTPLSNAPPVLAFTTVALGGFRGLIANALWIRAQSLQDADKYYEMVQLADWITKLEPHFVDVWRVQAWNMAYNISVKCKEYKDRWRWVLRGVELLRDDALRYNPREPQLYNELSWIIRHKIGDNLDDAHMLYKLRWAQMFEAALGGRPDFDALIHPKTPEQKARADQLRDVFKMNPIDVQRVDNEYGPLDWRLPDAHSIYWADMGLLGAKPKDQENLRRDIFQAMQSACRRGGMLPPGMTNVTGDFLHFLTPNLALVGKVNAAYEKMINDETDENQLATFRTAHKNFLKDAVHNLYVAGRTNQAAYWFNYLAKTYTNAFVGNEANLSVDQWAFNQAQEYARETDMDHITDMLLGMAFQEYFALIADDDARATSFHFLAQQIWNSYNSHTQGIPHPRIGLPPLPELRRRALDTLLSPTSGYLSPTSIAILRTKLALPATPAPASPPGTTTNAPPSSPGF